MSERPTRCHACRGALRLFAGFHELPRVTSDCRPWPTGGGLGVCSACHLVQAVIDDTWRGEAERIYAGYSLYHQSRERTEQLIFDNATGEAAPRSQLLLARLLERIALADRGRLLDVGCGTGPTLSAFSPLRPAWRLTGYDPHIDDLDALLAIPGVEQVLTSGLAELGARFDLVTMIHSLEHVVDPAALLASTRAVCRTGARLLVQVPWFGDNPFDLVIADHCSHFGVEGLVSLLAGAGFQVELASTELVHKEITVVAAAAGVGASSAVPDLSLAVERAIDWLGTCARAFDGVTGGPLGIFGTSIGGNWLLGQLQDRVTFFVDEDPTRAGSEHRGRPILRPEDVDDGARVLMPLPLSIARSIRDRLAPERYELVLPPGGPA